MARVCVAYASGCPRAQVDTALLFDYFRANGWKTTDSIEDADVVVVTSCMFDAELEAYSLRLLAAADRRRKPGSRLVATGCTAGANQDSLREGFDVTLVPPSKLELFDDVIGASVRLSTMQDPNDIEPYIARADGCFSSQERSSGDGMLKGLVRKLFIGSGIREVLVRRGRMQGPTPLEPTGDAFSIRVAWGCMGECTYCAIRFACGPLRSKPLEAVLSEFRSGLSQGYREFKLLAQDLGAYGQDRGTNILELLHGLFEHDGEYRLTLLDLNLRWVVKYAPEVVDLLAENAGRIRLVAMPVQSGSERTLHRMRRGHSAAEAAKVLHDLRRAAPDMLLATHAMVGFPGETERDCQETVRLLRAIRFDRVDVFDYSDRPGTESSRLPDKVDPRAIRSRSRRLRSEFNSRMDGLEYAVRSRLRR